MKFRFPRLCLLLVMTAATAAAQSTEPAAPAPAPAAATPTAAPTPKGRLPEGKHSDKTRIGKPILPDPDLLDGSSYDKEKRPLYGMISEIEMGEQEGGKSDKVSPDSGPAGPAGAKPPEDQKQAAKSGGAAPPPPAAVAAAETPPAESAGGGPESAAAGGSAAAAGGAGGGSQSALPQGPAGSAAGAQADNLKVPEGASGGGPGSDSAKPQAQKIGDASLQIQTLPQNTANVVGMQASNAQQFEKKVPSGGSNIPSNGNAGAEKGRVVPKGL